MQVKHAAAAAASTAAFEASTKDGCLKFSLSRTKNRTQLLYRQIFFSLNVALKKYRSSCSRYRRRHRRDIETYRCCQSKEVFKEFPFDEVIWKTVEQFKKATVEMRTNSSGLKMLFHWLLIFVSTGKQSKAKQTTSLIQKPHLLVDLQPQRTKTGKERK